MLWLFLNQVAVRQRWPIACASAPFRLIGQAYRISVPPPLHFSNVPGVFSGATEVFQRGQPSGLLPIEGSDHWTHPRPWRRDDPTEPSLAVRLPFADRCREHWRASTPDTPAIGARNLDNRFCDILVKAPLHWTHSRTSVVVQVYKYAFLKSIVVPRFQAQDDVSLRVIIRNIAATQHNFSGSCEPSLALSFRDQLQRTCS